jgi:hypothetical protein
MANIPDISKPSLEGLSYVLRHKETWPVGFVWDFDLPSQCALGLCREIWVRDETKWFDGILNDRGTLRTAIDWAEVTFRMAPEDADKVFYSASWGHDLGKPITEAQPKDVADAIDAYLDDSYA